MARAWCLLLGAPVQGQPLLCSNPYLGQEALWTLGFLILETGQQRILCRSISQDAGVPAAMEGIGQRGWLLGKMN